MACWISFVEYTLLVLCNCVLALVHNAAILATDIKSAGSNFPVKYNFTIDQPFACHEPPFLVIFVTSAVDHFDQRAAIRDTWGQKTLQEKYKMKVFFLVGKPTEDSAVAHLGEKLKQEHKKFQDMLQVNTVDTYENLSAKSIAMLQWMFTNCIKAKFLFKTDDDMFIHVENLLRDLTYTVHKHFVMGHIIAGASPMRDKTSKYYTPVTVYKSETYPKYVSGTGYVISGDLVQDLYFAILKTPIFWLEDIYITGIGAELADATYIFNGKFGYLKRDFDPCVYKDIITGHGLGMEEMRTMWRDIHDPSIDCSLPPIDS